MKIVYMGTSEFAVPALLALVEKYNVLAVVTQPDRPKGRSGKPAPPPVKQAAVSLGLPILQPISAKKKAFYEQLSELNADLFIVASYGQILSERILNLPKYGCINIHASILPKHRGASPIQTAIINGDSISGVTIMQMDKGTDTGDILHVVETPIHPDDTAQTLHDRLSQLGGEAILEALNKLEAGELNPKKQDNNLASHAGLLTKEMGSIDWCKSPRDIVNLVRGLDPWPGAFTILDDHVLKIWKAETADIPLPPKTKSGEIIAANSNGLIVCAGSAESKGAIRLSEIQAPGSKRMADTDYLKGRKIHIGSILT